MEEKFINLSVKPIEYTIVIFKGLLAREVVVLPDSTYGEWFFCEKNKPTFYVNFIDGSINSSILSFLKEHDLDIENFIIEIIENKLNRKVYTSGLNSFDYVNPFMKENRIEKFTLSQIYLDYMI